MNLQTELEINRTWFKILQKRGLYQGMGFEEYQALKIQEIRISSDPAIKSTTLDEVITDFKRNGSAEAQLLPKTFVEVTMENSRKAYIFGYQGLVTYFAIGTGRDNPRKELGLISTHMPGSSGGGGWGLNGTRKLQLATKPLFGWKKKFDPDEWIAHSTAWVYEEDGGALRYESKKSQELVPELWREIKESLGAG